MTVSNAKPIRKVDITSISEAGQKAIDDPKRAKFQNEYTDLFFRFVSKHPLKEQDTLTQNLKFEDRIRCYQGQKLANVAPCGADKYIEFFKLFQTAMFQIEIKTDFQIACDDLTPQIKKSSPHDLLKFEIESSRFKKFHKIDDPDFNYSPVLDQIPFLQIENLKKHRCFSDVINHDTLDLLIRSSEEARSELVNELTSSFVRTTLGKIGLHYTVSHPEKIRLKSTLPSDSEAVKFNLFAQRLNLSATDIKLRSLADPAYREYIEKEFSNFKSKISSLFQPHTVDEKQNFMQAELEELLLEEKKVKAKKSKPSSKQPPKPAPSKEPPAAAEARRLDPNEAPALKKEALAQPKPVRKSDYNSPEWKTVASPAKAEKTLSPTKILERMRACDLPKIHPRIKRWEFATNLGSIQGFSDCLIEDGAKKNIQRYKEQNETNLMIQLTRHLVPNALARILNSRDFKERYCYINESNHYFKIRLTVEGLLDEETIVSYGLDSDNTLFHFFIHPRKEVGWNQKLSEVAQNLDPSLPESYTFQDMNIAPEISLQENSNATAPTLIVTQKHTLVPKDIRLEILPKTT